MDKVLAVAVGSALGGVARYGVAVALSGIAPAGVPLATLLVNLVGSAAFGYLFGVQHSRDLQPVVFLGLATGFLGGFTTYATFNAELLNLAMGGQWSAFAGYVLLTLVACFSGGWLGFWTATSA
ncbi:MAG: CrcB family protein [Deltaproteobacteria bacterium]|nr:CrcB family protein [Deltaproteobacteria bacterium]